MEQNFYRFSKQCIDGRNERAVDHSYFAPEGEPWTVVLLHFATFLDACGYVGVTDRVEMMLDDLE